MRDDEVLRKVVGDEGLDDVDECDFDIGCDEVGAPAPAPACAKRDVAAPPDMLGGLSPLVGVDGEVMLETALPVVYVL